MPHVTNHNFKIWFVAQPILTAAVKLTTQLSYGICNESSNIPMWGTELFLDEMDTMSELGTLIMCACHQLTLNITSAVFRNH
jgi:hypothetical protein